MVMMGDPFVGNVPKKLSREELIQALRVDIAGELEAIMGYDAHAMATDDQRVKTILYSIRDEERQHVGELLRLMEILDSQEAQFLAKGRQEVEQLLNQKGQTRQPYQMQQGQQARQPAQSQQYQYSPYTLPGMQTGHIFQEQVQGQQTPQWNQAQHQNQNQNFNRHHGGTDH
ncbi:demethoxyubiquinone hydroxylase family protein [Thermincola ferriacetica]